MSAGWFSIPLPWDSSFLSSRFSLILLSLCSRIRAAFRFVSFLKGCLLLEEMWVTSKSWPSPWLGGSTAVACVKCRVQAVFRSKIRWIQLGQRSCSSFRAWTAAVCHRLLPIWKLGGVLGCVLADGTKWRWRDEGASSGLMGTESYVWSGYGVLCLCSVASRKRKAEIARTQTLWRCSLV